MVSSCWRKRISSKSNNVPNILLEMQVSKNIYFFICIFIEISTFEVNPRPYPITLIPTINNLVLCILCKLYLCSRKEDETVDPSPFNQMSVFL